MTRDGAAPHRLVPRLRHAARRRPAVLRRARQRDPGREQSAGHQGRGRMRHHAGDGGGDQRDRRRARHPPSRNAGDAGARLARDPRQLSSNKADSRSSAPRRRGGAASPAIRARHRAAACPADRDARCAPAHCPTGTISSVRAAIASTCAAARQFELIHRVEGLLDRGAAGQQPVRAQDHRVVRPEIAHEARALVEIDRRAFIVVIAEVADEAHRRLRQRQQAALHRRHRHAGARVGMDDAGDSRPRAVDRAVDDIARLVDAVIGVGLPQDVALESIFTRLEAVISR